MCNAEQIVGCNEQRGLIRRTIVGNQLDRGLREGFRQLLHYGLEVAHPFLEGWGGVQVFGLLDG